MKKSIIALVFLVAVVGSILVIRARIRGSVAPKPDVTVDRTLKQGDLITNGSSVQRVQGLLVRGTNAPTQSDQAPK
jgi:hypothetical protein